MVRLDLKDAFFCTSVHSDTKFLFVFKWKGPNTKYTKQLTRMVLLQGFWDSLHLFGQALAKALSLLMLEGESWLLHYGRSLNL